MAARLATGFFGEPFEWQRSVLNIMLSRDETDKYRVRTFGLAVPRQNGKSWDIRARCFYGAVVAGEKILYTCQHGDTSDEMFKDLSAPFDDEDEVELRSLLKYVRKTNGQQAIYLTNGGIIRFTTRTNSLARGKSYDVLIYDEAQELTKGQQEASLPTISASSKHNAQVIYIGTPPGPETQGTVFREMHDRVHSGDSKAAWFEWSVNEIGDVSDKARWYETNPSLGHLVDETAIEGELAGMSPDGFARERLGWWTPMLTLATAIPPGAWEACETTDPMRDGKLAYGVKFAPDGRSVALSVALAERGGPSYVELVDLAGSTRGTAWLSAWLIARRDRCACVVIDGKSGAAALAQRLRDGGMRRPGVVVECNPSGVQAAAAMLVDEVGSKTLSHIASPALDESATRSVRRDIGRDGFGFGDGPNSTSLPIESASLALWGARTSKRDPRRRQAVSW